MPINIDPTLIETIITYTVAGLGAFFAALWLALLIWTFRDMRARSRDILAAILAALVVALLNLPGFLIYLLLRPRETLAERYDRSLEEEALLRQIEERNTCPGCNRPTREHWLVCPHCATLLKKRCTQCQQSLELNWNVCAFCGTPAPGREAKTQGERPAPLEATPANTTPESEAVTAVKEAEYE